MAFRARHRWVFLRIDRGPRGGRRLWYQCAKCDRVASNQAWSHDPMPPCEGLPLWDPRTDLWFAQLVEMNQRRRVELPLLADLGDWWG